MTRGEPPRLSGDGRGRQVAPKRRLTCSRGGWWTPGWDFVGVRGFRRGPTVWCARPNGAAVATVNRRQPRGFGGGHTTGGRWTRVILHGHNDYRHLWRCGRNSIDSARSL